MVGRRALRVLHRRGLAANALGATLAYVYLTVVAPPQPPPEDEHVLYLAVAPACFVLAATVGRRLSARMLRPIERWLEG